MLARWFYRPADIPTVETRGKHKGTVAISSKVRSISGEIFWTEHFDVNDVSSLVDVITDQVTLGPGDYAFIGPGKFEVIRAEYIMHACRYAYNPASGTFKALTAKFSAQLSPTHVRFKAPRVRVVGATTLTPHGAPFRRSPATSTDSVAKRAKNTHACVPDSAGASSRSFLSPSHRKVIKAERGDWYREPRVGKKFQVAEDALPEVLCKPARTSGSGSGIGGAGVVEWSPEGHDSAMVSKEVSKLEKMSPGDFCLVNMASPSLFHYWKYVGAAAAECKESVTLATPERSLQEAEESFS